MIKTAKLYVIYTAFLFLLLSVSSGFVYTQTAAEVDSLNLVAHHHRFSNPKMSKQQSERALVMAQKIFYDKGQADALKMQGVLCLFSSDFESSIHFFQKSISYYEKSMDTLGVAACVNNLALIYSALGDYEPALKMNIRSYHLEKSVGNEVGAAQSLDNIGTVYYYLGNEKKAMYAFIEAAAILYKFAELEMLSQTLTHMSAVMNDLEYYQWSVKTNQMAIYLASKTLNFRTLADAYNNMSNAYFHLGDFQMARKNVQITMEYREYIGDQNGMMAANNIAGAIYREQGDLDLSDLMFINVLKLSQELGNKRQTSIALAEIGENLRIRGDLGKAENFLKESLRISREIGTKGLEIETLTYMMRLYCQKGETHLAFVFWLENQNVE
ncbi:MAG: tetratricopeptide repeat protein [Bacteroidales bacterium]|nr:tetratricopeptide repeat protein [Bacteroidales bacterium]MDY0216563.1 tetratricopeptide repeat protein [Bacteroidales bacterium]